MTALQADVAAVKELVKLAKGYPENLKDAGLLQDSDKYEVVEALGNSIPAIERLLGIVSGVEKLEQELRTEDSELLSEHNDARYAVAVSLKALLDREK